MEYPLVGGGGMEGPHVCISTIILCVAVRTAPCLPLSNGKRVKVHKNDRSGTCHLVHGSQKLRTELSSVRSLPAGLNILQRKDDKVSIIHGRIHHFCILPLSGAPGNDDDVGTPVHAQNGNTRLLNYLH